MILQKYHKLLQQLLNLFGSNIWRNCFALSVYARYKGYLLCGTTSPIIFNQNFTYYTRRKNLSIFKPFLAGYYYLRTSISLNLYPVFNLLHYLKAYFSWKFNPVSKKTDDEIGNRWWNRSPEPDKTSLRLEPKPQNLMGNLLITSVLWPEND